jgi:hypothetical protein
LRLARDRNTIFPLPAKVRAIQTALDIAEFDSGAVKPVLRDEFGLAPQTVVFGVMAVFCRGRDLSNSSGRHASSSMR